MCGICGYQGISQPDLIQRMVMQVAHRGPDDKGFWEHSTNRVALGHARLSIIDLRPEGRQPLKNEDGTILVICNGEIYNYRELSKWLIGKGHNFSSLSDSEVLLHLYEEMGLEMLSSLNGIFSFVIYDSNKNELFCARDNLGVKPFYYSQVADYFIFSSELKAILEVSQVPRDINPRAIHNHLMFLWSPSPDTMFRSIHKLEPGYAMVVREGRIVRHWRYYDIPYQENDLISSESEAIKLVQENLRQAVKRQLMADVEVGAFLSGGLDSSSVVAMMKNICPKKIPKCYTISYQDGKGYEGYVNDLPYARRVARHLGVDLEEVKIEADIVNNIEKMIYFLDEPQSDIAPINIMLICRQAHEQGIKVLLSGAGGDDIFSGYRRHTALYLENYWSWFPFLLRNLIERGARKLPVKYPTMRRIRKLFENASLDGDKRLISYFFWLDQGRAMELYSNDMLNVLGEYDAFVPMSSHLENVLDVRNPLDRMLYLEGKTFLPDHNLNYTDKMGMAFGVEVRVPLLDIDLIGLCTKISPKLKQNKMVGKYIFRKAMEPFLPREIIQKPKGAIPSPLRKWLLSDLRDMVHDMLSKERIKRRNWFDYKNVQKLIEDNESMKVDATYSIWSMVSMEIWADMFLDHHLPS